MSDTRENLIQLAKEQIRGDKLAAASFRELGKAAGIKSSSVHYHFQSRDNLLTEVFTDFRHEFFEELDQRTFNISKPRQRLLVLLSLFEDYQRKDWVGLTSSYAAGLRELNEESQQEVQFFLSQVEGWIAQSLNSASFLPISRESVAKVLISALEGALLMDRIQQDSDYLIAVREWICSLSSL